jgi:photosystem II stability/assembly factor-like uncharacterized protein
LQGLCAIILVPFILIPHQSLAQPAISWEYISSFPGTVTVLSVSDVPNSQNVLIAGTSRGLLRSENNGTTWDAFTSGIPTTVEVRQFLTLGGIVFAATSGGVFRSSNQGVSWALIGGTFNGLATPSSFAFTVSRSAIYVATTGGVYRSADNGLSWSLASAGLSGLSITSLTTFRDTMLFAGTNAGVYRSLNGGISWERSSNGISGPTVTSMLVVGNNILAGTFGAGVYRSADNGVFWNPISTGLQSQFVNSVVFTGVRLLASMFNGGVVLSQNEGLLWTQASYGLPSPFVGALSVAGGTPFVAGVGGGLYRGTFVSTPPPVISAVTPLSVTVATRNVVTVDGTGFVAPVVTVNGVPAQVGSLTPTRFTLTIPPEALPTVGTGTLEVRNFDGQRARASFQIVPESAPAIFRITPAVVTVGTVSFQMQVVGQRFSSAATLTVNGVPTPFEEFVPGNILIARVPVQALLEIAPVPVRLVNPNGESAEITLRVRARPPVITNVTPFAVSAGAPTFNLTIDGTDFSPTATVSLGNSFLNIVRQSTTQIVTTVPANLVASVGNLPLTVINTDAQSASRDFPVVNFGATLRAASNVVCPGTPIMISGEIQGGIEPFRIISWSPSVRSSSLQGRMIAAIAAPTEPTTYTLVIADASGVQVPQTINIGTIRVSAAPTQAAVPFDTVNTFIRWVTTASVSIRNTSADGSALTFGAARLASGRTNFRVLTATERTIVAAGQSSPPIVVQFQPEQDGFVRDTLIVPFEPCEGEVRIVLQGTRITPILGVPVLRPVSTSAAGTVTFMPPPAFAWLPVNFAASYALQIARVERVFSPSTGFASTDHPIVTTASTTLQPVFALQPNTAYAWSVRAVNSATTSTWSQPQLFITAPAGMQRLTVTPSLLDFGATLVGDNERRALQIVPAQPSSMTATLVGVDVFSAASVASVFTVQSVAGIQVQQRSPANINVSFIPRDTVSYQSIIRFRTATDTLLTLATGRGIPCPFGNECAETELVLRFAPFTNGKARPDIGDTVTLQLVLSRSARLDAARYAGRAQRFTADVIIQNPDVIYPFALKAPQSLTPQQVSISASRVRLTDVPIVRTAATEFVLAEIQAEALLADTLTTSVRFAEFRWTDAAADAPIRRILRDTSITLATCLTGDAPRLIRPRGANVLAITQLKPNPLIDVATVEFGLDATTPLTISLVDVMGRTLKTLLSGTFTKNDYTMTISAAGLPIGTYFLVFRTPTELLTERLEVWR